MVNNSATLPAAIRLDRLAVHFSTEHEDGTWLVELRRRTASATEPYPGGSGGEWLPLPGGATLRLLERTTPRLWRARLDRPVPAYLSRYGVPIRYSYVERDWPLADYQTVFGHVPGSAEMPSAGRRSPPGWSPSWCRAGSGSRPSRCTRAWRRRRRTNRPIRSGSRCPRARRGRSISPARRAGG
nr:hypothetical protein GCM10020093_081190 [Planobispora longispora]